jgi:hypothetical protein
MGEDQTIHINAIPPALGRSIHLNVEYVVLVCARAVDKLITVPTTSIENCIYK